MKHRFFAGLLACIMAVPFGAAMPASAASVRFAQISPRAGITVDVPYSCPYVYSAITGMEAVYPSGMEWTNDDFYMWNGGGTYAGGYGCVAFAYTLSDVAFGDLPCTEYDTFDASRIRVGDILRNSYHSVIVLEVHADHVVVAEGNINSSVLWGREISFDEIGGDGFEHHITRYPEGIAIREEDAVLNVGDSLQLNVISKDAPVLTWESSDTNVAAVDGGGIVGAVGGGEAVITAYNGSASDTFKVTVEGEPLVTTTTTSAPLETTAPIVTTVTTSSYDDGGENGVYGNLLYRKYESHVEITGCEEGTTEIVIPSEIDGLPVFGIAPHAFMNDTALTKVTLPDGLQEIGTRAFAGTSIRLLEVPDSVSYIGTCAFAESAVYFAELPGEVTVEYGAFQSCASLSTLYFRSNGMTELPEMMCSGCRSLEIVNLPGTVTTIGEAAFDGCSSLAMVGFMGSEADWNAMEVGDLNDALLNCGYIEFSAQETTTTTEATETTTSFTETSTVPPEETTDACTSETTSESTTTESTVVTPTVPTAVGDVDADGHVNAVDAAMILVAAAAVGAGNECDLSEAQTAVADVNEDGFFDSADAAYILQFAAEAGSGYTGSFEEFLSEILK